MHGNHPICPYTSKKACETAKRLGMGRCSAMKDNGEECSHWGVEKVDERAYCGQHIASVLLKEDHDRRAAAKRAELDGRISTYLAWRADHPSLHDTMRGA